eukprot:sb/3468422/
MTRMALVARNFTSLESRIHPGDSVLTLIQGEVRSRLVGEIRPAGEELPAGKRRKIDPAIASTPVRPPPANKHKAVKPDNVMRPKRQPLHRPRAAARRPLRPIGRGNAAATSNVAVVKPHFVKPKLALTVPKTPEMMRRMKTKFKRPVKILTQEEKEDIEYYTNIPSYTSAGERKIVAAHNLSPLSKRKVPLSKRKVPLSKIKVPLAKRKVLFPNEGYFIQKVSLSKRKVVIALASAPGPIGGCGGAAPTLNGGVGAGPLP